MKYVKVTGGVPEPYSLSRLRHDCGLSVRDNPDCANLADFGVYPVTIAPEPEIAEGEIATTNDLPDLIDGVWTLGWAVA